MRRVLVNFLISNDCAVFANSETFLLHNALPNDILCMMLWGNQNIVLFWEKQHEQDWQT